MSPRKRRRFAKPLPVVSAAAPPGLRPDNDYGNGGFSNPEASAATERTKGQETIIPPAPLYFRLLFSFPLAGLFAEWLLPLHRFAGTAAAKAMLEHLLLLALALLLTGSLRLPGMIGISGRLLLIALAWQRLCATSEGLGGWYSHMAHVAGDARSLVFLQTSALSEDSRLLLLALGWGLLVCSVQQLALLRGSTALFAACTLVYLLALDLFFQIDVTRDIPPALGFIVWLLAQSRLLRLAERTRSSALPYGRWTAAGFGLAAVLLGAVWAGGAVHAPQEAKPVSIRKALEEWRDFAEAKAGEGYSAAAEPASGAIAGTTGYGGVGQEMGAPLKPGNRPVFTAVTPERVYWRGDSAAVYDGRRWAGEETGLEPQNLTALPAATAGRDVSGSGRTLVQRIELAAPSAGGFPLFHAGTVLDIRQIDLADGSRLGYVLTRRDGAYYLPETAARDAGITGYTVESVLPERRPERLRTLTGADPAEVVDRDLQLPETLPARVKTLAVSLVEAAPSRYDAAAAVMAYLQRGYTYTLDTRIPPDGADFADDFLFVTKQGYCVHFATAMTVLLRAGGIPARYVQGYAPGTPVPDSMPQRVAVTEGDAHAWVEVYFPGAGWVPFDPTPAGPAAAALAAAPDSAANPAAEPEPSAHPGADAPLPALPQAGGPPAPPALAALGLAAAWRWRRALALLPALLRGGSAGRGRQLRAAALAWHGLTARFGAPPPGVTAREYARSLATDDAALRGAAMGFVRQWETLAYGGDGGAGHPPPRGPSGRPLSPPQRTTGAVSAADPSAAFIRRCLYIVLRLA